MWGYLFTHAQEETLAVSAKEGEEGMVEGGRAGQIYDSALPLGKNLRHRPNSSTGSPDRMSHRKWRSTKEQPSRARAGYQISCCLLSLHFLCDILSGGPVVFRYLLSICPGHTLQHLPGSSTGSSHVGAGHSDLMFLHRTRPTIRRFL